MTDEKLNEGYCQSDHLLTGGKTIRELYKITSMPKKYAKSWFAKQTF